MNALPDQYIIHASLLHSKKQINPSAYISYDEDRKWHQNTKKHVF